MRAWTALGVVVLTGGLAAGSQYLTRIDAPRFLPLVVYFWLGVAGLSLIGLLWLYFQIAVGPRATVAERTALKLERTLGRLRAGKGMFRERREKRLKAQAADLAARIEPAQEARNVFLRRVRLTNGVLALIVALSASFWIFTEMAPRTWPGERWFIDAPGDAPGTAQGPDAYHAALFSVDQVTRGTLFDLFDVFDWSISGYHNDPENRWFSAFIVIYRFLIGGALVAALVVRLGMHEDWREAAAQKSAEDMKARLAKAAGG